VADMPMSVHELTLATPHLQLAARRWNAGAPCRVLALHGWLDNAASFAELAPRLDNCDLVALDLPGHGASDHRPPGTHYHFVDFIPDALAAADALGWPRFALLGHSLGAGISCFTAAIAPQRVVGLALIEGIGPLSGDPAAEPDRLAKATRQMTAHGRREATLYPDIATAVTARSRAGGLTIEAAQKLVERALREDGDGYRWRSDARLRYSSPSYLSEAQVLAFLRRIRCPTLLVTGDGAPLAARPEFTIRCDAIAGLEHNVLPGGHHLHLENAAGVAGPISDFLTGLPKTV